MIKLFAQFRHPCNWFVCLHWGWTATQSEVRSQRNPRYLRKFRVFRILHSASSNFETAIKSPPKKMPSIPKMSFDSGDVIAEFIFEKSLVLSFSRISLPGRNFKLWILSILELYKHWALLKGADEHDSSYLVRNNEFSWELHVSCLRLKIPEGSPRRFHLKERTLNATLAR